MPIKTFSLVPSEGTWPPTIRKVNIKIRGENTELFYGSTNHFTLSCSHVSGEHNYNNDFDNVYLQFKPTSRLNCYKKLTNSLSCLYIDINRHVS